MNVKTSEENENYGIDEDFFNEVQSSTKVTILEKKKKKKKKKKKLTQKEIKEVEEYLDLSIEKRYKLPFDIINFYVIGEKERNNTKLIFFMKLGDILSKALFSKLDMHGDPSAGKSYICDVSCKLFPSENYYIIDAGSQKALRYDEDLNEEVCFIYLREMEKGSNLMADIKRMGDQDAVFKYVDFQKKITETIKKKRVGFLTTYSFEYTSRDLSERSWTLIPDQSIEQTERIIKFKLENRTDPIKRNYKETRILEKIKLFQNVIRYLKKYDYKVAIPFMNKLDSLFAKENLRTRRDVDKLPDLISIITIFNQSNKNKISFNNEDYLIADFEDLQKALEIGKDYFIEITLNLDMIKKLILDFMEFTEFQIITKKDETGEKYELDIEVDKEYTLTEIYEHLITKKLQTIHKNTLRNKLISLSYDNYIEIKTEGKGKAKKYKLLKDYERLDIDIDGMKDRINNLVNEYYKKWKRLSGGDNE